MTSKVLVTGGTGLLGSHVVEALAKRGVGVTATGRSTSAPHGVDFVAIDLMRPESARRLASLSPAMIVHAAAVLPRQFSDSSADDAARANRIMDDVIIETAAGIGCPVCYISGTSLYGCTDSIATEQSPLKSQGPYLSEKQRTEERLQSFGGRAVVLRVSAVYGAQQRSATVLQTFVRKALAGEDLQYFGSGSREQDFVAVEDVAAAAVASVELLASGTFNIASGRPVSMKELATIVISSLGSPSHVTAAGIDDPQEGCFARYSIERANRELHWTPNTSLETGILQLAKGLAAPDAPVRSQ